MANIIPERGINFKVYLDGEDLLGVAEGNFPNLESMTSEVKGAGIAGTIEDVVLGHFNSMTLSLTWRTTTDAFFKLQAHRTNNLDLYAALQNYDAGTGEYKTSQLHVFVKAITKTSNLGNLVVGDGMDTQTEFEIVYIKVELDEKERIEIDKVNYIHKVDGEDMLAEVRVALGKA